MNDEHPHSLGLPGDLLVTKIYLDSVFSRLTRDPDSIGLDDEITLDYRTFDQAAILISVILDPKYKEHPWCYLVLSDAVGWSWLGASRFYVEPTGKESV
jgi:hypothetical protein